LLRERSRELTHDELALPATQQLIDDLIDTMHAANGAGIAAPQVGELVRIATIEVGDTATPKPRIPSVGNRLPDGELRRSTKAACGACVVP
jgi:peptide deformylase